MANLVVNWLGTTSSFLSHVRIPHVSLLLLLLSFCVQPVAWFRAAAFTFKDGARDFFCFFLFSNKKKNSYSRSHSKVVVVWWHRITHTHTVGLVFIFFPIVKEEEEDNHKKKGGHWYEGRFAFFSIKGQTFADTWRFPFFVPLYPRLRSLLSTLSLHGCICMVVVLQTHTEREWEVVTYIYFIFFFLLICFFLWSDNGFWQVIPAEAVHSFKQKFNFSYFHFWFAVDVRTRRQIVVMK